MLADRMRMAASSGRKGMFVAVGYSTVASSGSSDGQIAVSNNGINWRNALTSPATFAHVAYGNDLWVALGPGNLLVSSDGISWEQLAYPESSDYGVSYMGPNCIEFANGLWTVATRETIITSPDLINWTLRLLYSDAQFNHLVYANNNWLVRTDDTSVLYTSVDGIIWNQIDGAGICYGLNYVNNYWFLFNSNKDIYRATDNNYNWQRVITAPNIIRGVAYGKGLYVFVGDNGYIGTTPNLASLTVRDSKFGASLIRDIVFVNNLFVAVGYDSKIATSPDGINWTLRNSGFTVPFIMSIAYSFKEV